MTVLPLLIVKTGTTDPGVVAAYGDYDDWLVEALPLSPDRIHVVLAYDQAPLPDPREHCAVILTGSPASVRDDEPWMSALGRWALHAAEQVPVLAVCFGHQLVGEALGGWVEPNPRGRELGTVTLELTAEGVSDPLFAGLSDRVTVQATHGDVLVRAPRESGVVRLAGNENTTWQAFGWGSRLRAVQFHPEIRPEVLRALLSARDWTGDVRDGSLGPRVLENWIAHWLPGLGQGPMG